MPHIFDFHPPLRASRGGPVLRMSLPDPALERTLSSRRLGRDGAGPYRKSVEVENLIDRVTMGIQPRTPEEGMLLIALGVSPKAESILRLRLAHAHVHSTSEPMRPDVLLRHSVHEGAGEVVSIAMMEELSLLAATMLRELGFDCSLATVRTAQGWDVSSLAIIHDGGLDSFTLSGAHPSVSRLTIFDDHDVSLILGLLRGYNELKRLRLHLEESGADDGGRERFAYLLKEFGSGFLSGHHAADLLLGELTRLEDEFPGLGPKDVS
jgi:hypothetical protein